MQIRRDKNPEITYKIPAASLLQSSDPIPSPIALNNKNTKTIIHWRMYNILVLAEANHKPKAITKHAL